MYLQAVLVYSIGILTLYMFFLVILLNQGPVINIQWQWC